MIRIEILDGRVDVAWNGDNRVTLIQDEAWLVVALALAPDAGLQAVTVRDELGVDIQSGALRKRIERLKTRTGLTTISRDVKSNKVYRLDTTEVLVDALRYLDLAEEVRRTDEAPNGALDTARSLWKAGPPSFTGLPNPAPEAYDRLYQAHDYLMYRSRRILIVDDQVGDLLASRLGAQRCEVAHDFKEYEQLVPRLDDFDLAVVDLHLTQSYADATGDAIVRQINSLATGLPVVMITLRPPENRSVPEWIRSLGLVDVIFKAGDEPEADMAFVAQRVDDLLREGPVERACDQLMQRVQKLRRKARERLRPGLSEAEYGNAIERMERDADRIGRLASANRLADARVETERFIAAYGE
ncbi:MAG: hypothetical protein ABIQ18_16295 [Umezawaea sp.]